MKRLTILAALSALTLLGACATATPYQAASSSDRGYSEQKIEDNRFQVQFSGNSLTDRKTVETYLLYRAAELTKQSGYDHFKVVRRDTDSNTRLVGSPSFYDPYYDHFFLNFSMAACKAMTDAGHNVEGSTVVSTMARNGTDFGIRVSGLGNRWFTAPAEIPQGLWFPGFTAADANPDIGDSAITETRELLAQGVKFAFVNVANSQIELIEPLGENSPILKFLSDAAVAGLMERTGVR